MKIGMKLDDMSMQRVQLRLERIAARVPGHAARALRRAMLRVVTRAKLYAPEDTTALVDSIRLVEGREGRRITFSVVMGGPQLTEWGVSLDDYAALVHENYDDLVTSGKYVGEGTRSKLARGVAVGEQFLTRAGDDERATILAAGAAAVKEIIDIEK